MHTHGIHLQYITKQEVCQMKLTSKSWIKLPLALKQLPGITKAAADVGAVIIHQCAEAEPCEISRKEIAEALGYAQSTVQCAVKALEAAGLIEAERSNGRRSRYRLTDQCRELCASALKPAARSQSRPRRAVTAEERKAQQLAAMSEQERAEMEEYLSLVNRFEED